MKKLRIRKSNKDHLTQGEGNPAVPSRRTGLRRELLSTFFLFAFAILTALFIKAYLIQPYVVEGQSMESTLQDRDRLLVNKLPRTLSRISGHSYIPHRGDIIIFNQSGLPGHIGEKQLIKRVVGLPGEKVVVKDGRITIYNSSQPAGFNPDVSGGYVVSALLTPGNINIPVGSNQVFVVGDNRSNSEDSRYFGPVSSNDIVGKLTFRILPLNKATHY